MRAPAAAPRISPARAAAFAVLLRVDLGKGHSDDLLHSMRVNVLSQDDRNLTNALVLGTLRWQLSLDAIIQPMLKHRDLQLQREIAIALRLGAFQLLHMDRIPAHAAINESVELARANEAAHAANMVNAILRGISREIPALRARISPQMAHPQWLMERWNATYGAKTADRIAAADQHEPLQKELFTPEAAIPVLDDGSRLVAELAAAAHPKPSQILDTCAAPGGKTMVLAMRHPAAQIVAVDISEKRLAAMRRRVEANPAFANIRTLCADMTQPPVEAEGIELYDLILCDAPCSGTGTLARNPEIRLQLKREEFARQAERQRTLLAAAIQRLAPGGRLLYSTCSLEPEENEDVLRSVLASQPKGIRQRPLAPMLKQLAERGLISAASQALLETTAIRGGTLRTLPGTHPFDGFFAAVIERT